MQPTFLPWVGYFALIDRVDEFIFLDNVQFDKRSWQQRNKIITPQGPAWLSVPIASKGKREQTIAEAHILYEGDKNPLEKIWRSIELNYKKAEFYDTYANGIHSLFTAKPSSISTLNQQVIKTVCNYLKIETPFVKSTNLSVRGEKDELLVDICKLRGAQIYISAPGSSIYLDNSEAFKKTNIDIIYHEYSHPSYSQLTDCFMPYMSILDLLFNEGPRSLGIIREGVTNA